MSSFHARKRRSRDTRSVRNAFAVTTVAVILLASIGAHAQKTTEIYIPIGQSPGISGAYSEIGEIVSFDPAAGTLTIRNERGEHTVNVGEDTLIWLDRSATGARNMVGTSAAFEAGRRCEIKHVYDGSTRSEDAEWIKVDPGTRPTA